KQTGHACRHYRDGDERNSCCLRREFSLHGARHSTGLIREMFDCLGVRATPPEFARDHTIRKGEVRAAPLLLRAEHGATLAGVEGSRELIRLSFDTYERADHESERSL